MAKRWSLSILIAIAALGLAMVALTTTTGGWANWPIAPSGPSRARLEAEANRSGDGEAARPPSVGSLAIGGDPEEPGVKLRLLVPAYFFPAGPSLEDWNRIFRAADKVPMTVIINPSSGPGEAAEPSYLEVIRRARSAHITTVGYVNTQYAKRPEDEVRADIEKWGRFYPEIGGIFLDAQAPGVEKLEYYRALRALIGTRFDRGLAVTNPGSVCSEAYFSRPATDTACVFEFPEKFDQFHLPPWGTLYRAGSFAALPYGVEGEDQMREYLSQAARTNLGYVYVTDAKGTNPWGRLPRYWEAEVAAAHRVNQRQAP